MLGYIILFANIPRIQLNKPEKEIKYGHCEVKYKFKQIPRSLLLKTRNLFLISISSSVE